MALVLLLLAGARWHGAAVADPVQVIDPGAPALVVVVQEGDCPERRGALDRWLADARGRGAESGHRVFRAVLSGPDPPDPSPLAEIRSLPDEARGRLVRALLRAGITGTPALLVLDESGRPFLGVPIDEDGPGPALRHALGWLEPLAHPHPLDPGVDGRWNR